MEFTHSNQSSWREASPTLLIAMVGSAVAAAPASLRLGSEGGSVGLGFLAYWGALALGVGALGVTHWRAKAEPVDGAAHFRSWLSILLTAGLSVTPLALLGRILKVTTHHRPLGAVVFAWLALFCVVATLVVVRRLLMLAASGRSWLLATLAGGAVLSVVYALVSLLAETLSARSVLLDLVLVSGTVALTLRVRPAVFARVPARVVWLGWLLLILGGLFSGQMVGVEAWQNAPLLAAALGGLSF